MMALRVQHADLPVTCHPNTLAMFEHWREKCGERRMPKRADIDPTGISPQLLPGIMIVDVVSDDRRYVYRLVGTGEVEVRGNDPTGRSVIEGYFGPSAEDALACYDRVVSTCAPHLDATPFTADSGQYVTLETLFLPLSDDGITVNKILAFSHSERVARFAISRDRT
jgi:hypothetical protein